MPSAVRGRKSPSPTAATALGGQGVKGDSAGLLPVVMRVPAARRVCRGIWDDPEMRNGRSVAALDRNPLNQLQKLEGAGKRARDHSSGASWIPRGTPER
jgi:hypothetical protein